MGPTSTGRDETFVESSGSTLPESDLAGNDLAGNDLAGNDLAGTDLTGTDLTGTDLTGTDLTGTDLTGTGLTDPLKNPLVPAKPVHRPKQGLTSTKKSRKQQEPAAGDSASTDEDSVPEPTRPKFRPPRTRARRPEPVPFDRLQPEPTIEGEPGLTVHPELPQPESELSHPDDPPKRGRKVGNRKAGRRTRGGSAPHAGLSDVAGWKLATAVLTALAVLAVGWGMYQTTKLNRNQLQLQSASASTSQRLSDLDNRFNAFEASTASQLADIQQQLTDFTDATAADQVSAKEQYAKVEQAIPVTETDFETAVAQVAALSAAYSTAKAASDVAPADQAARVKSLEAKSALLATCAKVWAGATQKIFNAENPQKAMADVGKDLAGAASGCKAITQ